MNAISRSPDAPAPIRTTRVFKQRDEVSRVKLLDRLRAAYEEMPCLRLTRAQARRLFDLRQDVCDRLLAELVRAGVLWQDRDGQYALRG